MMSTVGERVKAERKKRKWSQGTLAKMVGATQAAISEIERGGTKSSGLIVLIAKAFKMDAAALVDGKVSMSYALTADNNETAITTDSILIPPYDIKGQHGEGVQSNDVQLTDAMPFSRAMLDYYKFPEPYLLAVVRTNGWAMHPTIGDGELLIVNTIDVKPTGSNIYLICMNDMLFIRRFVYTPAGWLIRADNNDKNKYPDFVLGEEEMRNITIQGSIVWRGGVF